MRYFIGVVTASTPQLSMERLVDIAMDNADFFKKNDPIMVVWVNGKEMAKKMVFAKEDDVLLVIPTEYTSSSSHRCLPYLSIDVIGILVNNIKESGVEKPRDVMLIQL